MSYTKPKIYNLALSSLLLAKEVVDVDTDKSNEVRVLNIHYDIALESTLKDLDLDSLSTPITLELIEELTEGPWKFAYKYPSTCAFFRRIKSQAVTDTNRTHISKRVAMHNGQKVIFTNEEEAVAECIPNNIPLVALSSMAGMALAYQLAYLSAPLIVGKGAKALRDSLLQAYVVAKAEAQEDDARENFNYESDDIRSEFVAARIE
jgi:hypothetical protein